MRWFFILISCLLTMGIPTFADFTFVQISDTHVCVDGKGPEYSARYREAIKQINKLNPAFVILTGDALDYYSDANTLLIKEINSTLIPKLYMVPGNHDGQISDWTRVMGCDHISVQQDRCVFIGLDSEILNSGKLEESKQFDWLISELENAKGKRVFIFMHRPLFETSPSDLSDGYWIIKEPARTKLLNLFRKYKVEAVLNGHLHRFNESHFYGISFITTPAMCYSCARDQGLTGYRIFQVGSYGFTTRFVDMREKSTPPDLY